MTGQGCGSVLGGSWRHAGILLPMFESTQAKTCQYNPMPESCTTPNVPNRLCAMPWEKRYALPDTSITNTALYLTGVTFSGFNGTVCGMASRAIVANPTEVGQECAAPASVVCALPSRGAAARCLRPPHGRSTATRPPTRQASLGGARPTMRASRSARTAR